MPVTSKGFPLMLTFDLDAETMWTGRDQSYAKRPILMSQGAYGWKIGARRVLDLLDRYGLKTTFFIPGIIGVRPFVDLRVLKEPFIIQFRQGLDGTVSDTALGDRRLYAYSGFYFGWAATPHVAAGLEAFEEYAIDVPKVRDGAREAIVISPHVRITLPWVQPAISFFTNVGPPLYGANANIWGVRFAFTVVYDPSAMLRVRTR